MKKLFFISILVALIFASCTDDVEVTGVQLDKATLSVNAGDSAILIANAVPSGAKGTVVWSSSDTQIATVSGGVVKGIKEGTANIVATIGTYTATCVVTVNPKPYNASTDGIVGSWISKDENVSVLLKTYFAIDSITAKFKSDNTYLVESYSSGAKTTYVGTYVQTKPTSGTIWTIVLNQSSPTAVKSEGIFEVTGTTPNFTMKYEVAQTEPNIGATPPTTEAGFGSTNGGALSTWNVQTFVRTGN
ncbi:exported hypothetical protein [uncultured Paludibacter sp.]|nr:exported hypothetical protein [uncultured Paludibacter sp.]